MSGSILEFIEELHGRLRTRRREVLEEWRLRPLPVSVWAVEPTELNEAAATPAEAEEAVGIPTPLLVSVPAVQGPQVEPVETPPATGSKGPDDGEELCPVCETEAATLTFRGRPICGRCAQSLR